MRVIFGAFLLLVCASASADEAPYNPGGLKDSVIAHLIEAIRYERDVYIPQDRDRWVEPEAWRGNIIEAKTALREVQFNLVERLQGKSVSALIQYPEPREQYEGLLFKYSNSTDPRFASGIQFKESARKFYRTLIDGQNGAAVVVLIPPRATGSAEALVFCPRTTDESVVGSLKPYQLDLMALSTEGFSASASGKFLTSFGEGKARAWIEVSPNLAPPRVARDVSEKQYPSVDLSYIPGKRPTIGTTPTNSALIGGKVTAILETMLGTRREIERSVVVRVKQFYLDIPVRIPVNQAFQISQPGSCYAVVREAFVRQSIHGDAAKPPPAVNLE